MENNDKEVVTMEKNFEFYWNEIPEGKENAKTYDDLAVAWGISEKRKIRAILHELQCHDNGDDFILIRSSKTKGFYKTNDEEEIKAYKAECLSKGKSIFAPVRKINRILKCNADALQGSIFNNLRAVRVMKSMSQPTVVKAMREFDMAFDVPMLSKIENGVVLPTPYQLAHLANIYNVETTDLIQIEQSALDVFL